MGGQRQEDGRTTGVSAAQGVIMSFVGGGGADWAMSWDFALTN